MNEMMPPLMPPALLLLIFLEGGLGDSVELFVGDAEEFVAVASSVQVCRYCG